MAEVSFYLIHGYVLWIIWTFFGLFQISSNRYLKHYWRSHLWWHRISGFIVLTFTLGYGGRGYFKLRFVKDDVHAPMGITVTCVVLFLAISGVVARSRLNRAKSNQENMLNYKLFHKVRRKFRGTKQNILITRFLIFDSYSDTS